MFECIDILLSITLFYAKLSDNSPSCTFWDDWVLLSLFGPELKKSDRRMVVLIILWLFGEHMLTLLDLYCAAREHVGRLHAEGGYPGETWAFDS